MSLLLAFVDHIRFTAALANETDEAFAGGAAFAFTAELAAEADSAFDGDAFLAYTGWLANETDEAFAGDGVLVTIPTSGWGCIALVRPWCSTGIEQAWAARPSSPHGRRPAKSRHGAAPHSFARGRALGDRYDADCRRWPADEHRPR